MQKHFALSLIALASTVYLAHADHPIAFEVKTLCIDANEGCDVADFDGDGLVNARDLALLLSFWGGCP